MRLTRRIAIVTGIVALLMAGATFAIVGAQQHHGFGGRGDGPDHPMMMEHMLDRAAAHLGLSDEQKARIKAILDAEKPTMQTLRDQLKANHQELEAATANGAFDEAQVKAIAARQGETTAALIVEREKVKSQIFAILTPEQRQKAEQFHQRMGRHFKGHFFDKQ